MKYKITGILNNCALNSALPIMLEDIKDLATLEKKNLLPKTENIGRDGVEEKTEIRSTDDCYINYFRLKEIFCEVYHLDNDTINWQKFNAFLSDYNSFLAIQIIFLPVLRKFIGSEALNITEYKNLELLTKIQNTHENEYETNCIGKYNILRAEEACQLLHLKFYVYIKNCFYEEEEKEEQILEIPDPDHIESPNWTSTKGEKRIINLYHKNGHFEITDKINFDTEKKERAHLKKHHPELYNIINRLQDSNSAHRSNMHLAKLKIYVHEKLTEKFSINKLIASEFNSERWSQLQDGLDKQNFAIFLLNLATKNEQYKKQANNLLNSNKIPENIATFLSNCPLEFKESVITKAFEEINPLTDELISSINSMDFEKFTYLVSETPCDINSLVTSNNSDQIQISKEEKQDSSRLLKILINKNTDNKYTDYINLLESKGAEEEEVLDSEELAEKLNSNYSNSNNCNKKTNKSNSFIMLTSIYFKLLMLCILIIATLTLTAVILGATNLHYLVPAFLANLGPNIYNTIFGCSIGLDAIAFTTLSSSIFVSNKSCMFADKNKRLTQTPEVKADVVSNHGV